MALKDQTNLLLAGALVLAIAAGAYLSRRGEAPLGGMETPGTTGTAGATGDFSPGSDPGTPAVPADPRVTAAIAAIQKEDWEGARKSLEEIPAGDPAHAFALFNLGILHERLGKHDASREAFETLLALDPENADAWVALGWAQYKLEKPLEAERATLRALELIPNHGPARYNLALFRMAHGRLEEAVRTYKRAFAMDTTQAGFQQALHDLRGFSAAHPGDYRAHYGLALLYNVVNDPVNEVQALKSFLADAPAGPLREQASRRLETAEKEAAAASSSVPGETAGGSPAPPPGAASPSASPAVD